MVVVPRAGTTVLGMAPMALTGVTLVTAVAGCSATIAADGNPDQRSFVS